MDMSPKRLWARFVDASFPEIKDDAVRHMLRQRLLERTPRHRTSSWEAFRARFVEKPGKIMEVPPPAKVEKRAPLYDDMSEPLPLPVPLGSLTFPKGWKGRRHGHDPDPIDTVNVMDGYGNVVKQLQVSPMLARQYVGADWPTTVFTDDEVRLLRSWIDKMED